MSYTYIPGVPSAGPVTGIPPAKGRVGEIIAGSVTNKFMPSGAMVAMTNIILPPGVWAVLGRCAWSYNGYVTNVAYISVAVDDGSNPTKDGTRVQQSGTGTHYPGFTDDAALETIRLYSITSEITLSAYASVQYQGAGASASGDATITAFRMGSL